MHDLRITATQVARGAVLRAARPDGDLREGTVRLLRGLRAFCEEHPEIQLGECFLESQGASVYSPAPVRGAPLPVREWIRQLSREELDALNATCERSGNTAFRLAEEELRVMSGDSGTPEDQERWMHHPDERVPIAFLEVHPNVFSVGESASVAMYRHAVRSAEAEQVVWTPLLDKLGARGWPYRADAAGGHPPARPEDHIGALEPWMAIASETDLKRLLAFEHKAVSALAAAYAANLSPDMVAQLYASEAGPKLPDALALNPNLNLEARARLADLILTDARHDRMRGLAPAVRAAEAGRPLLPKDVLWRKMEEGFVNAIGALLCDATLEEHELLAIAYRLGTNRYSSYHLDVANHPAATPKVWLRQLELAGNAYGYRLLAACPSAMRSPEVRKKLMQSRAEHVTNLLLETASGSDVGVALRKWVRENSNDIERAFGKLRDEQVACLSAKDMTIVATAPALYTRMGLLKQLDRWRRLTTPVTETAPKVPLPSPRASMEQPSPERPRATQLGLPLSR
jgi:hypothetical protein